MPKSSDNYFESLGEKVGSGARDILEEMYNSGTIDSKGDVAFFIDTDDLAFNKRKDLDKRKVYISDLNVDWYEFCGEQREAEGVPLVSWLNELNEFNSLENQWQPGEIDGLARGILYLMKNVEVSKCPVQ